MRRARMAVLAALLAAVACGGNGGNGSPSEVVLAPVRRHRVVESVRASARLEAGREALLYGEGRIDSVAVAEGDTVETGQMLVALSGDASARSSREASLSALQAERIRLENARSQLERARRLYEAGALSAEQLDGAETALQAAVASHSRARAGYRAQSVSADAATVTAPFPAVVGRVWARPGARASASPMIQLTGMRGLQSRLLLPRRYYGRIGAGAGVTFRTAADSETVLAGTVVSVSPGLDPETGLLPVTVAFQREDGVLPGLLGSVELETGVVEEALAVPEQALRRTADCCRVIVVDDGVARYREVVTGLSGGGMVEVVSGLRAGEEVVVESTGAPADGDSVTVADR